MDSSIILAVVFCIIAAGNSYWMHLANRRIAQLEKHCHTHRDTEIKIERMKRKRGDL